MSPVFKCVLALFFSLSVMTFGSFMLSINTQLDNPLLVEVGRGIVGGPVMLLGAIFVMDVLTAEEKISFSIRKIAWVVSTLVPVGIIVFAQVDLFLLETLFYISGFFCSVWVTYWGCRLIIGDRVPNNEVGQNHSG